MNAFSGKIWFIIYTLIMLILIGCTGIRPRAYSKVENVGSGYNVDSLHSVIQKQGEKIALLEKDLIKYQEVFNNQSHSPNIYDDNDKNVIEFRKNLKEEVQVIIDSIQSGSFEEEITNTLIKMRNKIHILEDKTFYTDSLYFEIVNDLVMIDNQIESLISSYKEMNEISGKKKTIVIPKITNKEYKAKYIKSLAHYQNGEWNKGLDGFTFLIKADSNHDLADNCQYWIGEIYYALKDFRKSIKEFEKVFTFSGTNKSDDAQFKLGLCYVNIGQIDKAKQEFKNLLEFYPNSEYYKKSQEYLKKY